MWAAEGDAVKGHETQGSNTGLYFYGLELSDGTAKITGVSLIGDATSITIPSKFYDENANRYINISQVGEGTGLYALTLYSESNTGDCSSRITSVTISDGITTIAAKAFEGKTALASVTFGNSITTIGKNAFKDCTGLTSITFKGSTPPTTIDPKAFDNDINCILKVPDGATANYNTDAVCSMFKALGNSHNIHELTYPTITAAGWGTYYNDYGYTIPAGVEGYIITSTSGAGATANLEKVYDPGQEVVAGIALLWKSTVTLTETKYFTVEALSSGGNSAEWPKQIGGSAYHNLLSGSQTGGTTTAWGTENSDYYYYKLANGSNGLGWYFGDAGTQNGSAFTSGAHKAWLIVSKGSSSTPSGTRSFIGFDLDGTTAIESVVKKAEINDGVYYNLQGLRVDNPTKGLYIVNGKKVVIK